MHKETLSPASHNINDHTLKLIMGKHKNKIPAFEDIEIELKFAITASKKLLIKKKKLHFFNINVIKEQLIRNRGLLFKSATSSEKYKKTESERQRLKDLKKISTFLDGTK